VGLTPTGKRRLSRRTPDAVVAFYHRPRDDGWLEPFLASLRCVGHAGHLHCVGIFGSDELAVLARYHCTAHQVGQTDPSFDIENLAHLHISRVLDELAAGGDGQPDQVLVLDNVRAAFQRDPFQAKTIGLSVFCESSMRLSESEYNLHRLALFTPPGEARLTQPIISSALVRGPLQVVRAFYRHLLIEFVRRVELMRVQKGVQGAFNKACHDDGLEFPVIMHSHAAEAYFDFWPCDLEIDIRRGVRCAGAVPSVVLGHSPNSQVLQAVWQKLGLATSRT
jgi:hypothetical protein